MGLDSYELRSSAFYDIFNDSYDLMEEKTGRSLCRLAMAIPVPQRSTRLRLLMLLVTAAGPISVVYHFGCLFHTWSEHVVPGARESMRRGTMGEGLTNLAAYVFIFCRGPWRVR